MDFLKRNKAPITDEVWEAIDDRAREVLKPQLYARKFVDIDGPHGWEFSAQPLGRTSQMQEAAGVYWAKREVLPLLELKIPFELDKKLLDDINRGNPSVDLKPLDNAAKKIAEFEDNLIYAGLESTNIKGLKSILEERKMNVKIDSPSSLLQGINDSLSEFTKEGVEGPFALVIDRKEWSKLIAEKQGYPLNRLVKDLLSDGDIILSPRFEKPFLVSLQGGDLKLVVGQDMSLGYEGELKDKVRFYFTESLTFQIITPEAVLRLG
jgi:uncharacterized linocin/CFP29 family protein